MHYAGTARPGAAATGPEPVRRRVAIWVFAVLALFIFGAAIYLELQRDQALARVATDLGFAFTDGQHAPLGSLDAVGFYLFTQGPPLIKNRMEGERSG